ncbi:MAG: DUF4450 domain-containing protein [FCB group bacterium]|jgi:hypothetical protein|nr:DUF4450 domain-containing protein [FCB group bacterium]
MSILGLVLCVLAAGETRVVNLYTPSEGGYSLHIGQGQRPAPACEIGIARDEVRIHRRPLYPPSDRRMIWTDEQLAQIPRSTFRPLVVAYNEPRFLFDYHSAGGLLGHLYIGISQDGAGKWFHAWPEVDVSYTDGRMDYVLRDAAFPGVTVRLSASPLADSAGLIVKVTLEGATGGTRLLWGYGGASAFFTNYNMGAPEFSFSPAQCAKDRIVLNQGRFALHRKFDETDVATKEAFSVWRKLPGWEAVIRGGASWQGRTGFGDPVAFADSPTALSRATDWTDAGEKANCVAAGEAPPGEDTGYIVVGMGGGIEAALANPAGAWNAALARNASIADRVTTKTQDSHLDAAVRMMAFAQEGTWGDVATVHGGWSWRFAYLGWRTGYGPLCYGWPERIRQYIRAHTTLGLIKEGPDAGALGSMIESEPGVYYNMNEVFFDHVRAYFDYTNDLGLMGEIFPVLEGILAWESTRLQPENAGLYESALNTWISDSHWYTRGQCTQASAYMLNAHTFMARLARALGKDAAPFQERAARIRLAMQEKLWMPREGVFAEYLDTRGNRLLHPQPELPTLYHAAEFGAAEPIQAYQMLLWADANLRHEHTPGGGSIVWSSNWYPNRGRSYTHSTYEMAYGEELNYALMNYQCGRANEAYALLRGSLCGIFNGPTPGGLSCHAQTDGRQRANDEFADASSMWARAVVEGLFGIRPHLPEGYVEVTPQPPSEWQTAEIRTPLLSYRWRAGEGETAVDWDSPTETRVRLRLPLKAEAIESATLDGKPVDPTVESGFGGIVWAVIDCPGTKGGRVAVRYRPSAVEIPPAIAATQGAPVQPLPVDAVEVLDPQGIRANNIFAREGKHALFAKVGQAPFTSLMPIRFDIAPKDAPRPSLWKAPETGERDPGKWALVDLSAVYNDSVTEVLPHVEQRAPAPEPSASTINYGYWKDHLTQYHGSRNEPISDAAWRAKIGNDGVGWTRDGIPFKSPKEGKNIAVATVTGGFPAKFAFPVGEAGRTLYLMISGMTFPVQSHVPNLRVTLHYADGTSTSKDLVNPFDIGDCWSTWCGRFHDCAATGFENIGGRKGPEGSADVPDMTQPIELDTEAQLVALLLRPGAELAGVEFEAIANDVIFGVMGATVLR